MGVISKPLPWEYHQPLGPAQRFPLLVSLLYCTGLASIAKGSSFVSCGCFLLAYHTREYQILLAKGRKIDRGPCTLSVSIFCFSNIETLQTWWISFPKSGLPWSKTYQTTLWRWVTSPCANINGLWVLREQRLLSRNKFWGSHPIETPAHEKTSISHISTWMKLMKWSFPQDPEVAPYISFAVSRERLLAWPATPEEGRNSNKNALWFDEGNTCIYIYDIFMYILGLSYTYKCTLKSEALRLVHESVEQIVSLIVSWHLWRERIDGDNMKNVYIHMVITCI